MTQRISQGELVRRSGAFYLFIGDFPWVQAKGVMFTVRVPEVRSSLFGVWAQVPRTLEGGRGATQLRLGGLPIYVPIRETVVLARHVGHVMRTAPERPGARAAPTFVVCLIPNERVQQAERGTPPSSRREYFGYIAELKLGVVCTGRGLGGIANLDALLAPAAGARCAEGVAALKK